MIFHSEMMDSSAEDETKQVFVSEVESTEETKGFGGIGRLLASASSISNTFAIVGLSDGFIWMHHNPTTASFFSNSSISEVSSNWICVI